MECCVSVWRRCHSSHPIAATVCFDCWHYTPMCTLHLVLPACQESRSSHTLGDRKKHVQPYLLLFPLRHLLPSSQEVAVEFVSKYRQGWPLAVCRHPFGPIECCALRELTVRDQL